MLKKQFIFFRAKMSESKEKTALNSVQQKKMFQELKNSSEVKLRQQLEDMNDDYMRKRIKEWCEDVTSAKRTFYFYKLADELVQELKDQGYKVIEYQQSKFASFHSDIKVEIPEYLSKFYERFTIVSRVTPSYIYQLPTQLMQVVEISI